MGYILAAIKLIMTVLNMWTERSKALKQKKKEAIDEVVKGIKKKDASSITAGLIGLAGCSRIRPVVLHPIEKADIFKMEVGQNYSPEKSGWFVSDYYLEEVMRAKIGK